MEANALAIALSCVAITLSVACLLRGLPSAIHAAHETARTARLKAEEALETQVTFKTEVTGILEAIQDERERAAKLRARASAQESRARAIQESDGANLDRNTAMLALRKEAGLI